MHLYSNIGYIIEPNTSIIVAEAEPLPASYLAATSM